MSDLVKDLTQYRIRGIEKAEVEYYQSLTRTLDKIEDQIISLASKELPTQAGQLMELQSAVALRPKIKAILDKEYLPFADRVVRKGFGEQAKRVERQFKTIGIIPPEFRELTKSDLSLIKNLKQQYYTQFKDVSNNFTRILSDKVYQNTLVGNSFVELEEELRQSINGIYSTSNDPAVNRLVNYVKANQNNPLLKARVNLAIQQLQTKYARTRTGENMRRYAGQILNDSLRDFDATLNLNKAKDAGLKFVKYYGDVIGTTRDLCRRMINGELNKRESGIFSIDEIKEIWRNRSWSGKKSGNPLTVRGGYNCRHQFSYVNPDWYEEDGDEKQILTPAKETIKEEKRSKVPSVAIGSLLTRGSDKVRKAYEDDFNAQLTDQQKIIVNKYGKPERIINGKRGYYKKNSKELSAELNAIDKVKFSRGVTSTQKGVRSFVIAHEYGHHIDYETFTDGLFWSSNTPAFINAIKKDRRAFKGKSFKDLTGKDPDGYFIIAKEELERIKAELAETVEVDLFRKGVKIATRPVTTLKGDGYGEVSDIIDALARGKFRNDLSMWGHSLSYWRRNGSVEQEIFANLFSIRHNEKAYNLAKKYIPNTVVEFEKRLVELAK
jgi:hypothetical protein